MYRGYYSLDAFTSFTYELKENYMKPIQITKNEAAIANEEAIYLYGYLRKKYANSTVQDLDIIMNALCFALCRLIKMHVAEGEEHILIDIIYHNIKKEFEKKTDENSL